MNPAVDQDGNDIENQDIISVDLEKELNEVFDNEYDDDETTQSSLPSPPAAEVKTTRAGCKIHMPSKYSNYSMLLLGLITSQFVSIQDNAYHINPHKQVSFLQAQLSHKQVTETLFE